MSTTTETPQYTKKDFASDQDVRWCPGCGDYSILAAVQKVLPDIGVPKENIVFVSGIGCSSRFPYYMNTYGFHTIHGRAPAIATGLKIMNPELSVWVITGDGDSLSIGGNHFIQAARRNVDMNIILFNNAIYGLTKGQYSPTSTEGTRTKSSPYGSIDYPMQPLRVALGANSAFIARTADILAKHQRDVLFQSHEFKGTSIVEVLQNCHIFNDGVHKPVLDKTVRDDRLLMLESGKPMLFGKDNEKGIRFNTQRLKLEAVNVADVDESEILVHDPENPDSTLHFMLVNMGTESDDLPYAMGVIRSVERDSYESQLHAQEEAVIEQKGRGDLMKLLYTGETWQVDY